MWDFPSSLQATVFQERIHYLCTSWWGPACEEACGEVTGPLQDKSSRDVLAFEECDKLKFEQNKYSRVYKTWVFELIFPKGFFGGSYSSPTYILGVSFSSLNSRCFVAKKCPKIWFLARKVKKNSIFGENIFILRYFYCDYLKIMIFLTIFGNFLYENPKKWVFLPQNMS